MLDKPVPGHNIALLGSLQEAVEKILGKKAGIGPLEILKAVADGLEIASYPTCAGALRLLIDEMDGEAVGEIS